MYRVQPMFGRHPADAEFARALARIVLDQRSVARPAGEGVMCVRILAGSGRRAVVERS